MPSPDRGVRPPTGWPVAIFQHGLTRNRVDAVAIADAFASAGFVVVSIDLPLHGITPTNPLSRRCSAKPGNELHVRSRREQQHDARAGP